MRGKIIIISSLIIAIIVIVIEFSHGYRKTFSIVTRTANGETETAYLNGENVSDERKALEEKVKENVADYLSADIETLRFEYFCMLGNEGITVEVEYGGERYTFTCDMSGEIIKKHIAKKG